jgi:hypothetical protein
MGNKKGDTMTTEPIVEFENDRVRVIRAKRSGPGSMVPAERLDRLIIYLRDAYIKRKEGGKEETLRRRSGEVVWRGSSRHEVQVLEGAEHEVLIVELKP